MACSGFTLRRALLAGPTRRCASTWFRPGPPTAADGQAPDNSGAGAPQGRRLGTAARDPTETNFWEAWKQRYFGRQLGYNERDVSDEYEYECLRAQLMKRPTVTVSYGRRGS